MHGFSTVDGFFDVKEGVDEMIKYLANEPSVGLFFVQQHAQSSMPNLLKVKDKVVEKINEVSLHTEDIEDSITVVRSMTECGFPIADEMIKDINKSLQVMSSSQPKRGLIHSPSWGSQAGRSSFNARTAFDHSDVSSQQDGGSSRSYLSAVLSSAKQRAAGLRWNHPDPGPKGHKTDQFMPATEADELPLSSNLADDANQISSALVHDYDAVARSSWNRDVSLMLESYDKFRLDREAKLEEWLCEQPEQDRSGCIRAGD